MDKFHWTSRIGRIGSMLGTAHKKLVDDRGKVYAHLQTVAHGNRTHLEIFDPPMKHTWTCSSLEKAEQDVKAWWGLN